MTQVPRSPWVPESQHRRGVCTAHVYQISNAKNSQAGNVWFQPRGSSVPLPEPHGTTPPRAPPDHSTGDLDRWTDGSCLGDSGPEGPGRLAASHRSRNYHLAETKQLREKPAHLAKRPNQPNTKGNPHMVGLVKPSRKFILPNTPTSRREEALRMSPPGRRPQGPAASCCPPPPASLGTERQGWREGEHQHPMAANGPGQER